MARGEPGLYVDYCAKDFLDGTQMLDPWEELAYRRICDMIYVTNDRLIDDDRKLAWATKTGRRWPAIKAALTSGDKPKLQVVEGRITNARCQSALGRAAKKIAQKVWAGTASAASGKSLENLKQNRTDVREPVRHTAKNQTSMGYVDKTVQKKCSEAQGTAAQEWSDNLLENQETLRTDVRQPVATEHRTTQRTKEVSKEVRALPNGSAARARETAEAMLAIWSEECGGILRVPIKLTPERIKTCAARWGDSFGSDEWQWRSYCQAIVSKPFLRGDGGGWKADFDFALTPKGILGIREGKYDGNGGHRRQSGHAAQTAAFDIITR